MPKKETPESIEAELNATEQERLLADLREAVLRIEEFEAELQVRERAAGIKPERNKPLVDRLAALGIPEEAIEEIAELMIAFQSDALPERVRRKLAEAADAEISALDQLQAILDARRRKR